jgi:DNA-binding PadR family transcriptional regulator
MTHTQVFDDGWFRKAQGLESAGSARRQLHRHFRAAQRDPNPDAATGVTGAAADDGSERHTRGREHRPGWRPGGREFGRGGPEFGRGGPFGFGGPFGPFGPGRGRGGNRARRGDVRAAALILLAEEPRNGYQLIQELANRSDGAWRASPGSVYPALQQLEDEGLIRAVTDDGRKLWELTDAGRAYVEENRDKLGTPWDAVGGGVPDGVRDLADIGLQVGSAVHQVVRAGDDAQIAQAVTILTETRRALYRLLAGDDKPAS